MSKPNRKQAPASPLPKPRKSKSSQSWKSVLLPPTVVFFVAVWLWGWLWYGDVLRIAREYSFWSSDPLLMHYLDGRPWSPLWWAGQALLQLYRWPAVGALVVALFVSGSTWLLGYCLRLRGWWRLLQYLPAAFALSLTAYLGFDLFFETLSLFMVMNIVAGGRNSAIFSDHSTAATLSSKG